MKTRFLGLCMAGLLAVQALTGCQTGQAAASAGRTMEQGMESVGDTLMQAVDTTAPSKPPEPALSLEEAKSIALKHAGFTADQVTALHAEYEIEHGVPQYDVEFHHERWEYDYEIHADTGEILSYSKDD